MTFVVLALCRSARAHAQAVASATHALQAWRSNIKACFHRGRALLCLNMHARAARDFERVARDGVGPIQVQARLWLDKCTQRRLGYPPI